MSKIIRNIDKIQFRISNELYDLIEIISLKENKQISNFIKEIDSSDKLSEFLLSDKMQEKYGEMKEMGIYKKQRGYSDRQKEEYKQENIKKEKITTEKREIKEEKQIVKIQENIDYRDTVTQHNLNKKSIHEYYKDMAESEVIETAKDRVKALLEYTLNDIDKKILLELLDKKFITINMLVCFCYPIQYRDGKTRTLDDMVDELKIIMNDMLIKPSSIKNYQLKYELKNYLIPYAEEYETKILKKLSFNKGDMDGITTYEKGILKTKFLDETIIQGEINIESIEKTKENKELFTLQKQKEFIDSFGIFKKPIDISLFSKNPNIPKGILKNAKPLDFDKNGIYKPSITENDIKLQNLRNRNETQKEKDLNELINNELIENVKNHHPELKPSQLNKKVDEQKEYQLKIKQLEISLQKKFIDSKEYLKYLKECKESYEFFKNIDNGQNFNTFEEYLKIALNYELINNYEYKKESEKLKEILKQNELFNNNLNLENVRELQKIFESE
jgi:hypothetical protein